MGCLVEAVGEIVFKLVFLALLLPVMLVGSTPFVLVLALLQPSRYPQRVLEGYQRVLRAWTYIAEHAA